MWPYNLRESKGVNEFLIDFYEQSKEECGVILLLIVFHFLEDV